MMLNKCHAKREEFADSIERTGTLPVVAQAREKN